MRSKFFPGCAKIASDEWRRNRPPSVAAFCTSALTAVVGAGGGTALIALMLQILSPAVAIPVHGVVPLTSNTKRVWFFWQHPFWPIIFRFIALMSIGVSIGCMLFQGLPT